MLEMVPLLYSRKNLHAFARAFDLIPVALFKLSEQISGFLPKSLISPAISISTSNEQCFNSIRPDTVLTVVISRERMIIGG